MPVYLLALFVATLALLLTALLRMRTPTPVLLLAAFVFGLAAMSSLTQTARSMTDGFLAALATGAPLLLAGTLIEALRAAAPRAPEGWPGRKWALPLLGAVGGFGLYVEAGLAALLGLMRPGARAAGRSLMGDAARLALPLLAVNALLPPAPGPVAVLSILGADPWRALPWALLLAVMTAAAGLLFVACAMRGRTGRAGETPTPPDELPPTAERGTGAVAVVACAALLLFSLAGPYAALPGPWRPVWYRQSVLPDIVVALAQPFTLLVIVVAVAAVGCALMARRGLQAGLWERALARGAELALLVGAAGALAGVLQVSLLGETLADLLSGWTPPRPLALLLPFAIAAVLKSVLGSGMVALLTAASIVQPLLEPLGLSQETGRALAAVAVCAGALAVCHVNDSNFWITVGMARASAREGLCLMTLGSLAQAVVAAVLLLLAGSICL